MNVLMMDPRANAGNETHYDVDKRRLGLILPSINIRLEPELYHCPELKAFNVYTSRIKLGDVTEENLLRMEQDVMHAAEMLSDVRPEGIIFGCTSGSFIGGSEGGQALEEKIRTVCGCPVVTASSAMLDFVLSEKVKKLTLVTPYVESIVQKEIAFLQEHGVSVVSACGMGITDPEELRMVSVEAVREAVRRTDTPDADAVFISCTNLEGFHICGELEAKLGKPVSSSNLACLRTALKYLRS